MKKILTVAALAALMASSASAIQLSLVPGLERDGSKLDLNVSETGMVSIYMEIGAADGNVSFMNAFMDATPLNSGDAVGYDVTGNIFRAVRNDDTGWFRNVGDSSSRNIEDYSLIAADDEQDNIIGTDGPKDIWIDSIIIHATEAGDYDLYFENPVTAEGAPRMPGVFDKNNVQHGYAVNLQIPGFIWFRNAWSDPNANGGQGFDVPFVINVVPEPASLALLAVGGLALLRRRK